MQTPTLDRLFLEISQFTRAKTANEILLSRALTEMLTQGQGAECMHCKVKDRIGSEALTEHKRRLEK